MSNLQIKLSIIIVNYNGVIYLKNCIDSIKKHTKGINYEIIIVDNASTDNSVSLIKENYGNDVILIPSETNLGFSKGNNVGAKNATGDYILLLNNDTVIQDDLILAFEKLQEANVGALGIKMFGKNKEYRNSVGYFPNPLRLLKLYKLYKMDEGFAKGDFSKNSYEVNWIEASFLIVKKNVWDLIEGFDEDYFMYVEDIDLCKKIHLMNFRVIYLPSLKYIHFGGYNVSREGYLKKGFKTYSKKHFSFPLKQLSLLSIFLNFTFKIVKNTLSSKKQ